MKIPFTNRYISKSDAYAIAVIILMLFCCTADSWFE